MYSGPDRDYTQPGGFDRALAVAAAGASASAAAVGVLPFPPWAQLAALSGAATAVALKVVLKLRSRGRLALAGDEAAIAGFARRAARWGATKRKRKAEHILHDLQRVAAQRRSGRRHAVKLAKLKLKAATLYALEHGARINPNAPLVAGDHASIPMNANLDPAANMDRADDLDDGPLGIPWAGWALGGAAVLLVAALRRRSS